MEEISYPIGVLLLGLVMTDAWPDIRLPLGHNRSDLLDNDWVGRLVAARKVYHARPPRRTAWAHAWEALAEFEIVPVVTSAEFWAKQQIE
jgi:hypothetical protein